MVCRWARRFRNASTLSNIAVARLGAGHRHCLGSQFAGDHDTLCVERTVVFLDRQCEGVAPSASPGFDQSPVPDQKRVSGESQNTLSLNVPSNVEFPINFWTVARMASRVSA
jgi:hypothetical protein